MPTAPNYLTLTEEQQKYVRENSTKVSPDKIAAALHTSRHEVMKFIIAEKLSMKITKPRKTVK